MIEKFDDETRAKVASIILGDKNVYLRPYVVINYIETVECRRSLLEKLTFKRPRVDSVKKTMIIHAKMEPDRLSKSTIVFRFPSFVARAHTTVEDYWIHWFGESKKTEFYRVLEEGDEININYKVSL